MKYLLGVVTSVGIVVPASAGMTASCVPGVITEPKAFDLASSRFNWTNVLKQITLSKFGVGETELLITSYISRVTNGLAKYNVDYNVYFDFGLKIKVISDNLLRKDSVQWHFVKILHTPSSKILINDVQLTNPNYVANN